MTELDHRFGSAEFIEWRVHELARAVELDQHRELAAEPVRREDLETRCIKVNHDEKQGCIEWQWNGWSQLDVQTFRNSMPGEPFSLNGASRCEIQWSAYPRASAIELTPVDRDQKSGARIRLERPFQHKIRPAIEITARRSRLTGRWSRIEVTLQPGFNVNGEVQVCLLNAPGTYRGTYRPERNPKKFTGRKCSFETPDPFRGVIAVVATTSAGVELLAYRNYEAGEFAGRENEWPTDSVEWDAVQNHLRQSAAVAKVVERPWREGWPDRTRARFDALHSTGVKLMNLQEEEAARVLWKWPLGYTRALMLAIWQQVSLDKFSQEAENLDKIEFKSIFERYWPGCYDAVIRAGSKEKQNGKKEQRGRGERSIDEQLYLLRRLKQKTLPEIVSWATGTGVEGLQSAEDLLEQKKHLERLVDILPDSASLYAKASSLLEATKETPQRTNQAKTVKEDFQQLKAEIQQDYGVELDELSKEQIHEAQAGRVLEWLEDLKTASGTVPEIPLRARKGKRVGPTRDLVQWIGSLASLPKVEELERIGARFGLALERQHMATSLHAATAAAQKICETSGPDKEGPMRAIASLLSEIARLERHVLTALLEETFFGEMKVALERKKSEARNRATVHRDKIESEVQVLERALKRGAAQFVQVAETSAFQIEVSVKCDEHDRKLWEEQKSKLREVFSLDEKVEISGKELNLKFQDLKKHAQVFSTVATGMADFARAIESQDHLRKIEKVLKLFEKICAARGLAVTKSGHAEELPDDRKEVYVMAGSLLAINRDVSDCDRHLRLISDEMQSNALNILISARLPSGAWACLCSLIEKGVWQEAAFYLEVAGMRKRMLFDGRPPLAFLLWILPEHKRVRPLITLEQASRECLVANKNIKFSHDDLERELKSLNQFGFENLRRELYGEMVMRFAEIQQDRAYTKSVLASQRVEEDPASILAFLEQVWLAFGYSSYGRNGPLINAKRMAINDADMLRMLFQKFQLVPE